jgi:hypothetical protein
VSLPDRAAINTLGFAFLIAHWKRNFSHHRSPPPTDTFTDKSISSTFFAGSPVRSPYCVAVNPIFSICVATQQAEIGSVHHRGYSHTGGPGEGRTSLYPLPFSAQNPLTDEIAENNQPGLFRRSPLELGPGS